MARPLLIEFQDAFYHVISRGLNRQNLFLDEDDFVFFLWLLNQAQEKFGFICHGYCLMNNHYHLFLQTPNANLSKIMKFINESYARYFLNKYPNRDGHVFKGRYKRKLVQTDLYSLQLSRYIHLNPVKAGIVKHPHEWKWSSYNAFIGLTASNRFLNKEWILQQFSKNKKQAKEKMIEYTYEDISCFWNPDDYSCGKVILGSKEFLHHIINQHIDTSKIDHRIIAVSELNISKNQKPEYVLGQLEKLNLEAKMKMQVSVYFIKQHTNLSLAEIGVIFGKSSSAVSKIFQRVKGKISNKIRSQMDLK